MSLSGKDQETKHWLEIAKSDLGASKKLLEADEGFSAQAAFFAQQAAEKAIKGFLVWHQERFKKEHDIRYLVNLALKKDPTLKSKIDEATTLNPFAVTFRYPGEEEELSIKDVLQAIAIAKDLYEEILLRLPKEIHPSQA
jgi:HEPN domain-containing protein